MRRRKPRLGWKKDYPPRAGGAVVKSAVSKKQAATSPTSGAGEWTLPSPTNAWLLMGGQDSYPTIGDLAQMRDDARVGRYDYAWTAAKQTEPGDLLFFYFTAPRKAIHFVARAVDRAYFDDIGPHEGPWRGRQWWVHITPMVEIEPVTISQLRDVTGNQVMLGGGGRYLRPEHADQLAALAQPARAKDAADLAQVLRRVVGRADHPDAGALDLAGWRLLPAGMFRLETDVEEFVVEPLLRLVLADEPGTEPSRAYPAGKRIVDYVVLRGGVPVCRPC